MDFAVPSIEVSELAFESYRLQSIDLITDLAQLSAACC
jgi:hypothetical protein